MREKKLKYQQFHQICHSKSNLTYRSKIEEKKPQITRYSTVLIH